MDPRDCTRPKSTEWDEAPTRPHPRRRDCRYTPAGVPTDRHARFAASGHRGSNRALYIFAIIAVPKAEQLSLVAPGISRSRS